MLHRCFANTVADDDSTSYKSLRRVPQNFALFAAKDFRTVEDDCRKVTKIPVDWECGIEKSAKSSLFDENVAAKGTVI